MNRRKKSKKKSDSIGYTILAITVAIVLTAAAFIYKQNGENVEIDKLTYCPIDGGYDLNFIYIDISDNYTKLLQKQIVNYIEKIKNQTKKYEKLVLYTMDPSDEILLKKHIEICNPGDGSDASYIDSNPRLLKKRWKNEFSDKLKEVIVTLEFNSNLSKSPILESMHALSVDGILPIKKQSSKVKIHVFSDMLQHSDMYSHYNDAINYSSFKKTKYGKRSLIDLHNADVYMYYIDRNTDLQGRNHIEFWQNWFFDSNSNLVKVNKIK